jgi:hypothetical protein
VALARISPEPLRWLRVLVAWYEDTGSYELVHPIAKVLRSATDPAPGNHILERIDDPSWCVARSELLAALAAAPHPAIAPVLRATWRDEAATPWSRAKAAEHLLSASGDCEVARWLASFVRDYGTLDVRRDGRNAGYGADSDDLAAVLREHARRCEPCGLEWGGVLAAVHRNDDRSLPRLHYIARGELAALTGATTDDAVQAWLAGHRR